MSIWLRIIGSGISGFLLLIIVTGATGFDGSGVWISGFGVMLSVMFYHALTIYSNETERVVKGKNGENVPRWIEKAKGRSNFGGLLFLGGLGASIPIFYGHGEVIAFISLPALVVGGHLYFSKMCPYCKKINYIMEHKCGNCGNQIDLSHFES